MTPKEQLRDVIAIAICSLIGGIVAGGLAVWVHFAL